MCHLRGRSGVYNCVYKFVSPTCFAAGCPAESQKQAKCKPNGSQMQDKGKPRASQRQAKGKPKASQRQAKGKPKESLRKAKVHQKVIKMSSKMSSKKSSKLLRPDCSKSPPNGSFLDPILDQVLSRNRRGGALKSARDPRKPGDPPRKVLLYAQAWSMRMSIN